jgi:hypothetical protein
MELQKGHRQNLHLNRRDQGAEREQSPPGFLGNRIWDRTIFLLETLACAAAGLLMGLL